MLTSPADDRLIVDPSSPAQIIRAAVDVRARVWTAEFDSRLIPDGPHELAVAATTPEGKTVTDRVRILVNQKAQYNQPARRPVDYENAAGEWREKHILGTQLGPNENGRHWHSRHDAERLGK